MKSVVVTLGRGGCWGLKLLNLLAPNCCPSVWYLLGHSNVQQHPSWPCRRYHLHTIRCWFCFSTIMVSDRRRRLLSLAVYENSTLPTTIHTKWPTFLPQHRGHHSNTDNRGQICFPSKWHVSHRPLRSDKVNQLKDTQRGHSDSISIKRKAPIRAGLGEWVSDWLAGWLVVWLRNERCQVGLF